MHITDRDKNRLREIAKEYIDITNSDIMKEIVSAWYHHSRLEKKRPMILFESKPMQKEYITTLQCEGEYARKIELDLLRNIWHFYNVKDDHPLAPYYTIKWDIPFLELGGLKITEKRATDAFGRKVAHLAEHPIKDLAKDLKILKPLDFFVDKEATYEKKNILDDCFGDILPTQIRGKSFWTMGLTWHIATLCGLETLYMGMYDYPEKIHELMKFLMDEKMRFMKFMEDGDMLSLTNEADYYASGSYGYTNNLPQKDFTGHVRNKDLSILLDSQETTGVSPKQYEEFIFPYYLEMSKHFGSIYYGCCEAVEDIWFLVKKLHNLQAVSISPWCAQHEMADNIKGDYIFSRKPLPTLVSTGNFDENAIKDDLENTVKIASKCELEIIMKDVHSVNFDYKRMGRWVEIARDAVEKYYG